MREFADEQAALRRVATLVARQASQAEVFAAMAEDLGGLLGVHDVRMIRYETEPDGDDAAVVVASWGRLRDVLKIGERHPLGGENVTSRVFRTGAPARIDDYSASTGPIAARVAQVGATSAAGAPIMVTGRLWGAMIVAALDGVSLPAGAEHRLAQFTELVGTAIANTEVRIEIARLADEQSALRRIATLVAEAAPPERLFAKVAEEVATLLGPHVDSAILRYQGDGTANVVAVWGEQPAGGIHVGARLPVDGTGVTARVLREGRPVRVDDYLATDGAIASHAQTHGIRSAVGCPIVVEGRLWGAMVVAHYASDPFHAATEQRVAQFTDLVATAIANAEAQAEVRRLAEEQAALRRLALRVAQGAEPTEVFDAVVREFRRLIGAVEVGLMRAERPDEVTILAHEGQLPGLVRTGMRLALDGDSATALVLRTGRSGRIVHEAANSSIAEIAVRSGVTIAVGAPVVVDGRLWGVLTASWHKDDEPPPPDVEQRMALFAELVDVAIASADSRAQLTASRARVLSAGDEARRRVVRDLHDGAQQRIVHTIITLKLAQRALQADTGQAAALIAEALENADQSNAELRELAHGLLPSVLVHGGLRAGIDTVTSRLTLPVGVDVTSERLPPEIEASGYFIVTEALTNVVKHAAAGSARVTAAVHDGALAIEVSDDGVGGADPAGHGLTGITDRVAALGGTLRLDSPAGGGTVLTARLPLPG